MSHPPVGSHQGAILNVSGLADALVNNPAEAAKILEQHHQLDKRQRQQFLMQGRANEFFIKTNFKDIHKESLRNRSID